MERTKMVRPQWVRLLHKNGQFAGEFDVIRGIIRFVSRGGTIEYDLAARMAEAQQELADAHDAQTLHRNG